MKAFSMLQRVWSQRKKDTRVLLWTSDNMVSTCVLESCASMCTCVHLHLYFKIKLSIRNIWQLRSAESTFLILIQAFWKRNTIKYSVFKFSHRCYTSAHSHKKKNILTNFSHHAAVCLDYNAPLNLKLIPLPQAQRGQTFLSEAFRV